MIVTVNIVGTFIVLVTEYFEIKGAKILRIGFMSTLIYIGLDDALEDAAKSMGASKFYTFRKIILPILMPTVLAVIVLAFNNLLANYDLSVFLYHPSYKPLGIVIKTATEQTSMQDTKAMMFVYSVILMIISTLAIYFFYGRNTEKKE